MSGFEDIMLTDIRTPPLDGYHWYPLAFKLSRRPDKKWTDCLKKVYEQSLRLLIDQQILCRRKKEKAEFIFITYMGSGIGKVPDDEKEALNAILLPGEEKIPIFDEKASIIAPYLNGRAELILPYVDSRGCNNGLELAPKILPYVKQWIDATNECRQKQAP